MDKSCNSSGGGDSTGVSATTSSASSSSGNRDIYIKHLNKISHKISKPIRRPSVFENQNRQNPIQAQAQQAPPTPAQAQLAAQNLQPQPQQQPPVYNINKSDFRDVVQKLTGSPAHERISTPPPIHQPKAPSSRLQRIRPPPLSQIGNRPPPIMNVSGPSLPNGSNGGGFVAGQRPVQPQPLSPLPPFPGVHAAAESPISAYMRFLQSSISSVAGDSDPKRFSTGFSPLAPLASPRWSNFGPPPQQLQFPPPQPPPLPQQQNIPLPPTASSSVLPPFPAFPSSPLPFGCLPSPRSPYGLLSPGLLLSPSGQLGFQQLPLSPTLPVPSPRWKGI